jgi:hypothetical protein
VRDHVSVPEELASRINWMLDVLWLSNKDKPGSTSDFCDAILEAFALDQSGDRFMVNAYVYKKMEPELLSYIAERGRIPCSALQNSEKQP